MVGNIPLGSALWAVSPPSLSPITSLPAGRAAWETEKTLSLCKHSSAIAQDGCVTNAVLFTNPKRSNMRAAMKKINYPSRALYTSSDGDSIWLLLWPTYPKQFTIPFAQKDWYYWKTFKKSLSFPIIICYTNTKYDLFLRILNPLLYT